MPAPVDVASTPKPGEKVPGHIAHLRHVPGGLKCADNYPVELWELVLPQDDIVLSEWAERFRNHYCADDEIDELRRGPGLSRADYLTQLLFPDEIQPPGPAIRAGDFAELLVSDFVEFILGYDVPRGKYAVKAVRNESVKGVDVVGFRMQNGITPHKRDRLTTFEVKAQLTGLTYSGRLQTALNDSAKDYLRLAETLNATKQRCRSSGDLRRAAVVERFQNRADRPYEYIAGAAAVLTAEVCQLTAIAEGTAVGEHPNAPHVSLVVIRGDDMMQLVHALYKRAADEA